MTSTKDTPTYRPLEDTTVIELGHIVAGPFCSLLLAEFGADVIKVEHGASGGDSVRDSSALGNSVFNTINHNKRSVSIDLKTDDGMEVFRKLVADADVFVENLRPGAPEGLGIGYDALSDVNEELIYCSIKGFNEGPYQDFPALDPVAEALSGLMSVTGHPGNPPARAGTSVADMAAALFGAIGIVAALRQREFTGEGQYITAPLFESTVSLMGYWLTYTQVHDTDPEPLGAGHLNWSPYDVYETADDRWVFVGPSSQKQWERLCEVLGVEFHEEDQFETIEDRRHNEDVLDEKLAATIAEFESDELVDGLQEVGVPVADVQKVSEVSEDEHLTATDALGELRTAAGKDANVSVPKNPVRSSQFDQPEISDPPGLGADTEEVLQELGYSVEEIERLRENGAL